MFSAKKPFSIYLVWTVLVSVADGFGGMTARLFKRTISRCDVDARVAITLLFEPSSLCAELRSAALQKKGSELDSENHLTRFETIELSVSVLTSEYNC